MAKTEMGASQSPGLYLYYDNGGIYSEIQTGLEGNPEGGARGIFQGLRLYFTKYPDLSPNTDIINF